jgi:flagellar capping protein FliD
MVESRFPSVRRGPSVIGMTQPQQDPSVDRLRNDIDGLYELTDDSNRTAHTALAAVRGVDLRLRRFQKSSGQQFGILIATLRQHGRRLTRIEDRLDRMDGRFDGIDQRLDGIDQRLDHIDQRSDGINQRFDHMDERFNHMDERMDGMATRADSSDRQIQSLAQKIDEILALVRQL